MNWNTLYSYNRFGSKNKSTLSDIRNPFVIDYDRILFSASFRKLQNKTQVFPLPHDVFVHNRLTHSLEVASVGRSLGSIAGKELVKKYSNEFSTASINFYQRDLEHVIAAASLCHDIGNPPFGHSGEVSISSFFNKKRKERNPFFNSLSELDWCDLCSFEGNANGFRLLIKNAFQANDEYKLTYTTLASMVKYPTNSLQGNKKDQSISEKKYGYFSSEEVAFKEIVELFEIPSLKNKQNVFVRHPFVFLVEAADDICYLIIDFEDACNLGIISYEDYYNHLIPFFQENEGFFTKETIDNKLDKLSFKKEKTAYLRAVTINLLTQLCAEKFVEVSDELLKATVQVPIIELLNNKMVANYKKLKKFSVKNIYQSAIVSERELMGFQTIESVLEKFISCMESPNDGYSKMIKQVFPEAFYYGEKDSVYVKVRKLLDYIASLSDFQIMEINKKLL